MAVNFPGINLLTGVLHDVCVVCGERLAKRSLPVHWQEKCMTAAVFFFPFTDFVLCALFHFHLSYVQ